MSSTTPQMIADALSDAGLTVHSVGDTVDVEMGAGLMKNKAAIDTARVGAAVDAVDEAERKAALSSVARGVYGVLVEPKKSKGAEMSFLDAAAVITPSLEGPLFALGVELAGGDPPYLAAFAGDVSVAYYLELDRGVRVLTQEQVDRWDVHPNRIEKAAVSILYHRTGWREPDHEAFGELTVDRYKLGDGFDAARALILDMLDYNRCRKGLLFAVPDPDVVLFTDDGGDQARAAFKQVAAEAFAASDAPLSPDVFRFEDGHRVDAPL